MSLLGIDVGSSSVKVAAYSEKGESLSITNVSLTPLYPGPGLWETDPEDVWRATSNGILQLMTAEAVKANPPRAIAISASGRENFPADKNGMPLANGIMGADVRGSEFEAPPEGSSQVEPWCLSCGHLRERMDPMFRLAWWRKYHPEILQDAYYYFGWIDFLHFRMTGHAIADHSTVSRYSVYDLRSMNWDLSRVGELQLPNSYLPGLLAWGEVVGELKTQLRREWGMPAGVVVGQGCHDLNCAAYGAGVHEVGTACLVSGSYENVLVPTDRLPTEDMLVRGLSVMPQPCKAGRSIIAVHPTGNSVLNWIRELVKAPISDMERKLGQASEPSPVMSVPYLSGSMTYWKDGRKARGALVGLTLATEPEDVVQAFMESIAYDLSNTFSLMQEHGVEVERIRIMGGGARSHWWTQLKADITGMPIEVVGQDEPGTFGAALLAGLAVGVYDDLEEISSRLSETTFTFFPDGNRARKHEERLQKYRDLMGLLIDNIY